MFNNVTNRPANRIAGLTVGLALLLALALALSVGSGGLFGSARSVHAPLTDTLTYDGQAESESGTLAGAGLSAVDGHQLAALQSAFAEVSSAAGTENVLQYGWDSRNMRAWIKITGLDIAKGLITVAVAFCSRYVPAALCRWAGDKLKYLARNIKAVSSHGAWLEISWNGRWRGGTW